MNSRVHSLEWCPAELGARSGFVGYTQRKDTKEWLEHIVPYYIHDQEKAKMYIRKSHDCVVHGEMYAYRHHPTDLEIHNSHLRG